MNPREMGPDWIKGTALVELARAHAWTPCSHYRQCIGYCPICWTKYLLEHHTEVKKLMGIKDVSLTVDMTQLGQAVCTCTFVFEPGTMHISRTERDPRCEIHGDRDRRGAA